MSNLLNIESTVQDQGVEIVSTSEGVMRSTNYVALSNGVVVAGNSSTQLTTKSIVPGVEPAPVQSDIQVKITRIQ
jgi:hypothetical protein